MSAWVAGALTSLLVCGVVTLLLLLIVLYEHTMNDEDEDK